MSVALYRYCPQCGTPTETRVIFDRTRAVCPACGFIHFTDPKVAAGVIVELDGRVLLVRRNNEPFRGYWSFPAGFVDAFEDPLEAARRECLEETGLEVDVTGLLQVIGGREHPNGADIVIVYRATVIGGQLHAGDDADQAEYFSYTSLPPLAFHATRKALGLE